MKRIFYYTLIVLCVAACGQSAPQEESTSSEYETMSVSRQDISLEESYPASIEGRQSIRIIPRVEGYLQEIRVKEGQRVRKGQVLFVLDQAKFDAGYHEARRATVDAMNGLSAALFTTLVFMVIFIPVSFISGTTGIFYKQFGLTMAVAVGISLLVALTLAPALCALILRPTDASGKGLAARVRAAYNVAFGAVLGKYTRLALTLIKRKWVAGLSIAVALALMVVLMRIVPTGFVPDEDMGSLVQPLFNAGRIKGNIRIAKAAYEESLASFTQTLLVAGTELRDALSACTFSSERIDLREQEVEAAGKACEASEALMQSGSATYLEVLSAQAALLQSRLSLAADRLDLLQGQINLYKALGRL